MFGQSHSEEFVCIWCGVRFHSALTRFHIRWSLVFWNITIQNGGTKPKMTGEVKTVIWTRDLCFTTMWKPKEWRRWWRLEWSVSRMWGNSIGDEGAEAFAEALRHHPRLTNLRWEASCVPSPRDSENPLTWSHCSFLRSSLSANGITSKGGKLLAEALMENSVLRIFWWANHWFWAQWLCCCCKWSSLWIMRLCCRLVQNELTDDAAPHLAELVKANTGLSHLWYGKHTLTPTDTRVMSPDGCCSQRAAASLPSGWFMSWPNVSHWENTDPQVFSFNRLSTCQELNVSQVFTFSQEVWS